MKRLLILLSVLALLLAACATTAPSPSAQGTITELNGGKVTIATADSQSTTVTVDRGTQVWWASGLEALRSSLATGQRVKVWSNNGTATKIVIEP